MNEAVQETRAMEATIPFLLQYHEQLDLLQQGYYAPIQIPYNKKFVLQHIK